MSWQEFTGADREEAVAAALRKLGVAESDLEFGDLPADDDGAFRLVARVRVELEADDDADADDDDAVSSEAALDPAAERERQKEIVLDFLVDLLEAFDLEGEIVAEYRDDILHIDINGDDLGALIGRRGMTMAALAEITKTVVQRRTAERVRLHLDVQGYRARRRTALEKYAVQLAEDVQQSGVEKALEPMSASDRKIVHDAVLAVDGVRSYSEGSEPRRNVVISPA